MGCQTPCAKISGCSWSSVSNCRNFRTSSGRKGRSKPKTGSWNGGEDEVGKHHVCMYIICKKLWSSKCAVDSPLKYSESSGPGSPNIHGCQLSILNNLLMVVSSCLLQGICCIHIIYDYFQSCYCMFLSFYYTIYHNYIQLEAKNKTCCITPSHDK